jgi:hypothetical protein
MCGEEFVLDEVEPAAEAAEAEVEAEFDDRAEEVAELVAYE